jgi:hypothetical protein
MRRPQRKQRRRRLDDAAAPWATGDARDGGGPASHGIHSVVCVCASGGCHTISVVTASTGALIDEPSSSSASLTPFSMSTMLCQAVSVQGAGVAQICLNGTASLSLRLYDRSASHYTKPSSTGNITLYKCFCNVERRIVTNHFTFWSSREPLVISLVICVYIVVSHK